MGPRWPVSRCAEGCCCVCKQLGSSGVICLAAAAAAARGGPVPQRGSLYGWDILGLCELAHPITHGVGAVELFQDDIFLLSCCKYIKTGAELKSQKLKLNTAETRSLDPFNYSGRT